MFEYISIFFKNLLYFPHSFFYKDKDERERFLRVCHNYGMNQEDLGREFLFKGKKYKIIGISAEDRARPIVCGTKFGRYNFSVFSVLDSIGK